MARPKPAKERGVTIAVVCNLTDLFVVEPRTFGIYPVYPVIPGIQYVVRCQASLKGQERPNGKTIVLPGGGARKEVIRQCEPGEEYALTEISDARASREEGNGKIAHDLVEAFAIADDIVRSLTKTMAIGGFGAEGIEGFSGVFVCDDERPSAQELKTNRERLLKCDAAMVESADTNWAFYKNPIFCVEAIASAKRLKIEDRDWLSVYKPTKECPMCFTKVDPRAVVCKSCNHVINKQAAIQAGYLEAVPEPQKPHQQKSV